MSITLKSLPLLALLAWAAPLAAQEAPADAPAQVPAAEGAAPAAGLDMGEPAAPGEPRVGEAYTRETFGEWALRCLKAEEGPDPCQLYQLLKDEDGNNVAEISMFPLPEGQRAAAGATIVAPLETLLTEELTLSVDGNAARRYPFTFCNRAGCVARVGFTQEELDQFKAGNAAQLSIVPAAAPDQTVNLAISLSGFTAGFDSSSVPAPAQE
ncbi:invasion associated locus B family protein [Rubellimicrobium aerolatum]|uniref:Invasion associated locus B family protein n=1 Tax=Rubellimicrobium aerolatum TaxID=490979 RepID=A0ABW0S7X8_9RHOB|nr:invasion associated locus B family protein [Rubellimicrobium aerolatum]MBP1804426.1 invasion protein IalB [Rubellimicrobium aerolatum]